MSIITKQEQDVARIMQDPVLWAEAHLGQKPRWYQEQILRHPHHRKVLRCGRRLGKCIAGTQRMVNAETGEYETLDVLFRKQQVSSFTLDDSFKIKKDVSFRIEQNGEKPTFKVTAKHGSQVQLTGNHPVLTLDGWKEVDLLKVGENIAVPKQIPVFGKNAPGIERAKAIGYITGTKRHTLNGMTLQLTGDETRQGIVKEIQKTELRLIPKTPQTHFLIDKKNQFADVLSLKEESIPKEVFMYDKEHLSAFIAALFDAKGWNYSDRIAEIGIGSKENQFARDLKHLLLRFSIDANIVARKVRGEQYYQLMVYAKRDVINFVKQFAPSAIKDYEKTNQKALELDERYPSIPKDIWKYIEKEREEKNMMNWQVTGQKTEKFRKNLRLTEDRASRYAENLQSAYLHDLAHSDVLWEEVTSIEEVGTQMTYDVYMPKHHNLIVEDIFVHNTWTMCAHMLWAAFTNLGGKKKDSPVVCVVATPYDNQARLIFDELRKFIDGNPILKDSLKSITKNPYYIELKNGSSIKLFTAGTRSGSGGASLRGQAADVLYMDRRVVEIVPTCCEAG